MENAGVWFFFLSACARIKANGRGLSEGQMCVCRVNTIETRDKRGSGSTASSLHESKKKI